VVSLKARLPLRASRFALLSFGLAALTPAATQATTLADAISAVRYGSPVVAGQQAQLQQSMAEVGVARANGRPQLDATANLTQGAHGYSQINGFNRTLDGEATLTVPLYSGGKVRDDIRASRQRVVAGEGNLIAATDDEIVKAITAYLDVLRDRAIVKLNEGNLALLEQNLRAAHDRFKGGDVTRTDLAQSTGRLQLGRSRLIDARNRLAATEETYRQIVGQAPGTLDAPPALPALPEDPAQAERLALGNSPDIAASIASAQAARLDVDVQRDAGRPTLSATAIEQYHRYSDPSEGVPPQHGNDGQIGAQLNVPIYQGGLVKARVKQARALASQAGSQRDVVERQVVAQARSATADYTASLRMIRANADAVDSNRDALSGVRTENAGGERTVLDILNAQLELLDSQVALETARHDAYVAGVNLLRAMGDLDCLTGGPAGGSRCSKTAMVGRAG
jgi:outer membrane protein